MNEQLCEALTCKRPAEYFADYQAREFRLLGDLKAEVHSCRRHLKAAVMSETSIGRCTVCLCPYDTTSMAVLSCGHAFHFVCVEQWLKTRMECPMCRKKTTRGGVIRVFIDTPDQDAASQVVVDDANAEGTSSTLADRLRQRNAFLEMALQTQRHEHQQLTDQMQLMSNNLETVQNIAEERRTRLETLNKKHANLKDKTAHLSKMVEDTDVVRARLKEVENRLRASEFYSLLSASSTSGEEEIDKFLGNGGEPAADEFLKIAIKQRKEVQVQLNNERKRATTARSEMTGLRNRCDELVTVAEELFAEIRRLSDESGLPVSEDVSRAMSALSSGSSHRRSLGFDCPPCRSPSTVLASARRLIRDGPRVAKPTEAEHAASLLQRGTPDEGLGESPPFDVSNKLLLAAESALSGSLKRSAPSGSDATVSDLSIPKHLLRNATAALKTRNMGTKLARHDVPKLNLKSFDSSLKRAASSTTPLTAPTLKRNPSNPTISSFFGSNQARPSTLARPVGSKTIRYVMLD